MNERHVVLRDRLPPDPQGPEVVVPAVGSFNDPSSWAAARAADERWFSSTTDVWNDSPDAHGLLGIGVVVALVEAEVDRARCPERAQVDGIKCRADHPLVVDVGAGERDGERNAAPVGQYVPLGSELGAIGRIGTSEVPPLGAFTLALSSEAQVQSMPRCSS
jgi:hypothetical protein